MGRAKERLEDLQLKGTTLKRMSRPSDDPIGNVDLLFLRSRTVDNQQYQRNSNFALAQLNFAETALTELTDIMVKAKELAIGQSSDLYNPEVRKGVANEVHQMRQQVLGISNRRVGSRYVFAGQKTLTRPFETDGGYKGDNKQIFLEVAKDFFAPVNLTGKEVFFQNFKTTLTDDTPFKNQAAIADKMENSAIDQNEEVITKQQPSQMANREMAGEIAKENEYGRSIFKILESLETAMVTNDTAAIQNLLHDIDDSVDRVVALRTKIGSIANSIQQTGIALQDDDLKIADSKSKIEDADVTELFSDISRQQSILEATYKTGAELLNSNLLKFLR